MTFNSALVGAFSLFMIFPEFAAADEVKKSSFLFQLVSASQAVCYNYRKKSDSCSSVSYFSESDNAQLLSYDVVLFSTKNAKKIEIMFGQKISSQFGAKAYLKVVFFGPTKIRGTSVCTSTGDDFHALLYASDNENPWIISDDKMLGDASDKIKLLLEGTAKIKLGLNSVKELCTQLSLKPIVSNLIEYEYASLADGIELPREEKSNRKTVRFYFSSNAPKLRIE